MNTLKIALRGNAASCIAFALIFLIRPSEVATFLGHDTPPPEALLMGLGSVLLVNGFHLLWASFKPLPSRLLILYFSIGDFLWFFASSSLVILGIWVTTEAGVAASTIVAVMVAAFGVLQISARNKMIRVNGE